MNKRRQLAIGLPVLAILALLMFAHFRSRSLLFDSTASEVAKTISKGDWRRVYNMSSDKDREFIGLSEPQFSELMRILTEQMAIDLSTLKMSRDRSYKQTMQHYIIAFGGAEPIDGREGTFAFVLRQQGDRAYVDLAGLVFGINRYTLDSRGVRYERLRSALSRVGAKYIGDFSSNSALIPLPRDPKRRLEWVSVRSASFMQFMDASASP